MEVITSVKRLGYFSSLGHIDWRIRRRGRGAYLNFRALMARLKEFRALKSSKLEHFRNLNPNKKIGPKILQFGTF